MTRTPRHAGSTRLSLLAALTGITFGLWLAACGGAVARPVHSDPTKPDAMGRGSDQRRADIERLSQEIATAMEVEPGVDGGVEPYSATRCEDSCKLSESICDNAEQICRIADELAPDDWAAGKCTDAKASCDLAHDRCRDCV